MNPFVLLTDLSCDIEPAILKTWGVDYCSLTMHFEDAPEQDYYNDQYPLSEFYNELRAGRIAKTSAVPEEVFREFFTRYLEQGLDILYLAFSSGLSATYNNSMVAAGKLRELYPERRILISDTRAASSGMGLLVWLTVQKRDEGLSLDELFAYAEETRFHLCHWFTVDDLKFLKRGGRVSAAAAFVGGVLSIKPVLHMDDPGHLIPVTKVTGRKNSLQKMADKYGELAVDPEHGPIFISHGDCIQDAEKLAAILKERYNAEVKLIQYVGSVIGAHSGPGTLALFFVGKNR